MNKSTLSLITALVDTEESDLYRDIYFPIIKYSIVDMHYAIKDNKQTVYTVKELKDAIKSRFDLDIPFVVLQHCVSSFGKVSNGISIKPKNNGKEFELINVADIYLNAQVDTKSHNIEQNLNKLEDLFQRYLGAEKLASDKTLIDFFSDNTDDVIEYLNKSTPDSKVNEDYVNVGRFLQWIAKENADLYAVVDNIFFASLVAGFLQRQDADPAIKSIEKCDYYLDTALILSLLKLSNEDAIQYAKELLSVIQGAGSCARIHAITAREINNIFQSIIESGGPWSGSSIEEPYRKQKYTISKLISLKSSFIEKLGEIGIEYKKISDDELDAIQKTYRSKSVVKELAEQRGGSQLYGIRDVHDVYMRDYVNGINKNAVNPQKQKAYFVTINTDLIRLFHKTDHPLGVIHSAKVVMNLWLHTSRSSMARKSALTLAISRCFDINNQDIHRKLNLIMKYFSEGTKNPEYTKAIYSALLLRSKNVLNDVDKIIDNENTKAPDYYEKNKEIMKTVIEVAVQEKTNRDKSLIELDGLKDELKKLNQGISDVSFELKETKLELLNEKQTREKAQKEAEILRKSDQEKKEFIEKIERQGELRDDISQLKLELIKLEVAKDKLETERSQYVKKHSKYIFYLFLESMLFIFGIASIGGSIYGLIVSNKPFTIASIIGVMAAMSTYLIAFTRGKSCLFDKERAKGAIEKELSEIWNQKTPKWKETLDGIASIQNLIESKSNELKSL